MSKKIGQFNHNQIFNTQKLEKQIQQLMIDDDITNKKGIFEYVLTGNENKLNIRAFTPQIKREAYEQQKGICAKCKKEHSLEEMQADHITPWSKGGKTSADNCQMLCADCNRRKSNIKWVRKTTNICPQKNITSVKKWLKLWLLMGNFL